MGIPTNFAVVGLPFPAFVDGLRAVCALFWCPDNLESDYEIVGVPDGVAVCCKMDSDAVLVALQFP